MFRFMTKARAKQMATLVIFITKKIREPKNSRQNYSRITKDIDLIKNNTVFRSAASKRINNIALDKVVHADLKIHLKNR